MSETRGESDEHPDKKDPPEAFTLLFWTDQEIDQGKNGDYSRSVPTIEAMNAIAGKDYPAAIGGKVATPDFVASAGDSCGWPTHACVQSWNKICKELVKFPMRPVAGNHDSGGKVPSETFYRWMRKDPFIKAHASDNGIKAWTAQARDRDHSRYTVLLPPQGHRLHHAVAHLRQLREIPAGAFAHL